MLEVEHSETAIPAAGVLLDAIFELPNDSKGLVIFAHGSGSNRRSPRNGTVAELLRRAGFGTFQFDLLTAEEQERYKQEVFDIGKLSARLVDVVRWASEQPELARLPVGLNGASTGAAAALNAAAELGGVVKAVVSRGGRPDLAYQDRLKDVTAATLFIIGGDDTEVLEASVPPYERLLGQKRLAIVPGATHVFEEAGTLEEAARLTVDWFLAHLK